MDELRIATVPMPEPSQEDDGDTRERRRALAEAVADSVERLANRLPTRYANATPTEPAVVEWVRAVVAAAVAGQDRRSRHVAPRPFTGPSLLLLGPTGTGKTHQAWGAIRALAVSGLAFTSWQVTTAADVYARMRPRHKVDAEEVFERYAHCAVLVLDDLGAAKSSEWVEEVNYRLINHRYEHARPTLVSSNLLPKDLAAALGGRVASRLHEMCTPAVLSGDDRRKTATRALPAGPDVPLPDVPELPGVPMPADVRRQLERIVGRKVPAAAPAPAPNDPAHAAALARARRETAARNVAAHDETTSRTES